MKRYWNRLKLRLGRNSAIKNTISNEDPEILSAFLLKYPSEMDRIFHIGMHSIDFAPWHSLILCISLLIARSNKATVILDKLLNRNISGWARLNEKCVRVFIEEIRKIQSTELLIRLLVRLIHHCDHQSFRTTVSQFNCLCYKDFQREIRNRLRHYNQERFTVDFLKEASEIEMPGFVNIQPKYERHVRSDSGFINDLGIGTRLVEKPLFNFDPFPESNIGHNVSYIKEGVRCSVYYGSYLRHCLKTGNSEEAIQIISRALNSAFEQHSD